MKRSDHRPRSWRLAFCGMSGALCIALMLLGVVIPVAMYIAPGLAAVVVMLACAECGRSMAWTLYTAVSLLGILFVPDKEVAFTFVFLGYYPLVKPYFDALRPTALCVTAKVLFFNVSAAVMLGLLWLLVFGSNSSVFLMPVAEWALAGATLAIGNAAFLLFDRGLVNLLVLYRMKWRPRLYKMVGRW